MTREQIIQYCLELSQKQSREVLRVSRALPCPRGEEERGGRKIVCERKTHNRIDTLELLKNIFLKNYTKRVSKSRSYVKRPINESILMRLFSMLFELSSSKVNASEIANSPIDVRRSSETYPPILSFAPRSRAIDRM